MVAPSPVAGTSFGAAPPAGCADRRGRSPGPAARSRLSPLARALAAALLVKFILLAVLWFAFFRSPVAPEMTMAPAAVAARVVGAPVRAEVPHGAP